MILLQTQVFVTVLMCLVYEVRLGSVEGLTENIAAQFNTTVLMKWRITPYPPEEISNIKLFIEPSSNLIMKGTDLSSTLTHNGTKLFGDRLSAAFLRGIYTVSLKEIRYTEAKAFKLEVVFLKDIVATKEIAYAVIRSVKDSADFSSTTDDKGGSNITSVIVGVVVGVVLLIAIVIFIVLFLRWRNNRSNQYSNSEQKTRLHNNLFELDDDDPKPPPPPPHKNKPQVYAHMDRSGGGGRNGSEPEQRRTDYAQMQLNDRGYPVNGPTIPPKPAVPPKPTGAAPPKPTGAAPPKPTGPPVPSKPARGISRKGDDI